MGRGLSKKRLKITDPRTEPSNFSPKIERKSYKKVKIGFEFFCENKLGDDKKINNKLVENLIKIGGLTWQEFHDHSYTTGLGYCKMKKVNYAVSRALTRYQMILQKHIWIRKKPGFSGL